jgi:hypothetical protein
MTTLTTDEILGTLRQVIAGNQEFTTWTVSTPHIVALVKRYVEAEREACLDVVKTHRIPVGNSSAGEMACEWTYGALKEIVAKIQARGEA